MGVSEHTGGIVDGVFALLGWAMKPLPPFMAKASCLGAVFDLTEAEHGLIYVGNRAERVDELVRACAGFLEDDDYLATDLEKMRGRLLIAHSLCYGRFAACALRAINKVIAETGPAKSQKVTACDELRAALAALMANIAIARPRAVHVKHRRPILLLTDGAFEEDGGKPTATVGGVLLVPEGMKPLRGPEVLRGVGGSITDARVDATPTGNACSTSRRV